jgi:Domain of unknown function (DUF4159)/Aerotolerance regulator N-terminal
MIGLPIAFGAPLLLAGLAALPIIWWLLRLTPPRPSEEIFPPLKILLKLMKREETPQKSPWWLTLLRLTMAGLVVVALAEPVLNPQTAKLEQTEGPLAIVIDNSWASSTIEANQKRTAANLLDLAEKADRPVILAATAAEENAAIGPFDAATARERLAALKSEPVVADTVMVSRRLAQLDQANKPSEIAWLSAGLESKSEKQAFDMIGTGGAKMLQWFAPAAVDALGISSTENTADSVRASVLRTENSPLPDAFRLLAFDEKNRPLGEADFSFAAGAGSAVAELKLPLELRNDIASLSVEGAKNAAATRLIDDSMKRKRVALVSGSTSDLAQTLLSPLYYISRALAPYADVIEPRNTELGSSINELLDNRPSVLVMADVGAVPQEVYARLDEWIGAGGVLIRFAGPRLAASVEDTLLPVRLRKGERALDGSLSWTVPQNLLPFGEKSPFAGVAISEDLSVSRQVLAEPSPDLSEKSWADLRDGTPLVTGEKRGRGMIVLYHVTPNAGWSNLPLTGTFVEMLRRTVGLAQAAPGAGLGGVQVALPPLRMIAADGRTAPPPPNAKPLPVSAKTEPSVSFSNPPGLYGTTDGAQALNLLKPDDKLVTAKVPVLGMPVTAGVYQSEDQSSLKGPLFLAALVLLALDCLAMLWLTGAFAARRLAPAALAAIALIAVLPNTGLAQDSSATPNPSPQVNEADAIEAITKTRLAYVKSGNEAVDKVSYDGLFGLTVYLNDRTALEPEDPIGLDLDTDELVFYPMIYWPIDASAPMPSAAAIARADAYMRQGGSILFDTRDQDISGFDLDGGGSPNNQRLREILKGMNVPPLEPVPADHVLSKAFYLLNDFPGRYRGGELWVEATAPVDEATDRPVRTGDGVSPILISSNDFASAWAMDNNGNFQFSTVPSDSMQREYAFRSGVNIMMYMLTGNYKSDQVHVPALLERLGQ